MNTSCTLIKIFLLLMTRTEWHEVVLIMGQAPIISIHSYRGGTGKTFLAANLAHQLTSVFQKRILIIDFDVLAGNLSSFLMKEKARPQSFINDYIKGTTDLSDLIIPLSDNLDVIPAMKEEDLLYIEKKTWINTFRRLLADLDDVATSRNHDLILFDNHPAIFHPTITSLALSNIALWLIRANKMSIANFLELLRNQAFLDMLRQKNTKIIINMMLSEYESQFDSLLNELKTFFPIIGVIPFWGELFTGLGDFHFLPDSPHTNPLIVQINNICKQLIR